MISLLIPGLWGVYDRRTFNEKIELIKQKRKQLIVFFSIFIAICFIQLTYWKIFSGSFWYDSYYNPGEGMDLLPPHTLNFLLSFRNGWLIYTPVIIFSFIGFYFLYKKNKQVFFPVIAYFIVNLWIVSSWTVWWYGYCFSQRGIIASYIILSIPMGYVLTALRTKKFLIKYSVLAVIFFLVALNLFQSWQAANGILISSRATPMFWIAVFGETSPLPDAEKMLYKDWPTNGIEKFTDETEYVKTHTWELHFEPNEDYPQERLSTEIFHSGKSSYIMDSIAEYSPGIKKKYSEITNKYHAWIRISVWVYPLENTKQHPTGLVATFTHHNQAYKYNGIGTDQLNIEQNKWSQLTFDYLTPMAVRSKSDPLDIYLWNNGKGKVYIDDFKVEVFEPKFDPSIF
jgi:hypothetical protein